MTLVGAFVAGAVTAAVSWWVIGSAFRRARFLRTNYRGRSVPTAAGVLVVAALVWLPTAFGGEHRDALLVAVVGLAALGFVDDVYGGEDRGFRGHLRALAARRVTTGMVKLVGGLVVAVAAVWLVDADVGTVQRLADAALVALAANLGNLFDRAPGRTTKVALAAFAVLVATTGVPDDLGGVALVVGGASGLLAFDLRERLMLGDAGANAVGGALGLGVVLVGSPATRLLVLAVVVLANAASEVVSFSRVIDAVPPLRVADRAGRPR